MKKSRSTTVKPKASAAAQKAAKVGKPSAAEKRSVSRSAVEASAKRPTNLTLDSDALARGNQFSKRTGTSLSKLVSGFLRALPADVASEPLRQRLTPAVKRLHGIARSDAKSSRAEQAEYHAHILQKYGG